MKRIAILSVLLCLALWTHAQTPHASPDTLLDRFGNKFALDQISIGAGGAKLAPEYLDAGLFRLYFEETTVLNAPNQRSVLQQVYTDLSYLLKAGGSFGDSRKVNVIVKNPDGDMPPEALAGASALFSEIGTGVTSGGVWEYINSITDPFEQIGTGDYYHGLLMVRTTLSGESWYVDAVNQNMQNPEGEHDFYTVMLHEAFHMLGFFSAIQENGTSDLSRAWGVGQPGLYSHYDLHLFRYDDVSGEYDKVINEDDGCYGMQFFDRNIVEDCGDLFFVYDKENPGISDKIPVYARDYYQSGSSFSHFLCETEDDNYLMTMASSTGKFLRHPNIEEVRALQSIGYDVTWEYGTGTVNEISYIPVNNSDNILVGVDDLRNPDDSYRYQIPFGGSITITVENIVSNDVSFPDITGIKCPEIVIGGGFDTELTNTSNLNAGDGSITFNSGDAYIKYRPVNSAGSVGNVAYIMVNIIAPDLPLCQPDNCNLICNGDFENLSPSNMYDISDLLTKLDNVAINNNSPDLYVVDNTGSGWEYKPEGNCGHLLLQWETGPWYPTYNGQSGSFVFLGGGKSTRESICLPLNKPIPQGGGSYKVGFYNKGEYSYLQGYTQTKSILIYGASTKPINKCSNVKNNFSTTTAIQTTTYGSETFATVLLGKTDVTANWTYQEISINNTILNNYATLHGDIKYLIVMPYTNAGGGVTCSIDNLGLFENNTAKISIESILSDNTVCVGDEYTITYTLKIPNTTPLSTDVTYEYMPDSNVEILSGFTPQSGHFVHSFNFIADGVDDGVNIVYTFDATYKVLSTAPTGSVISNYGMVTSTAACSEYSSGGATTTSNEQPAYVTSKELDMSVSVNTESMYATYTVTVSDASINYGSQITGINIENPLPAGLGLPTALTIDDEGVNTITYNLSENKVYVEISHIPASGNVSFTYTAEISGALPIENCFDIVSADNACNVPVSACKTVDVVITSQPLSSITVCEGESATFSIQTTGAVTDYKWYHGIENLGVNSETLTINPVSLSDIGEYYCVINGAVTSNTATLTVNPLPNTSLAVSGTTVCAGEDATVIVVSAENGVNYEAFIGAASVGTVTGNGGNAVITISNTHLGNGNNTVTFSANNGCPANLANTATVVVNPLPNATITANGATEFCAGGTVTLSAASNGNGETYLWTTGETASQITVATSGTYTVEVTDTNGCKATANQSVTVNPLPNATITANGATEFCDGGNVTLSATPNGNGETYLWTTGETTSQITVATSGTYSVDVTDSNGCKATANQGVTVNPLPNATLTVTPNPACAGDLVTCTAGGGTAYEFFVNGTSVQSGSNNLYTANTYTGGELVSVTVSNGICSAEVSETIQTIANTVITTFLDAVTNTTIGNGGNELVFTVTADGEGLDYQWQHNGADIDGANSNTFSIPAANVTLQSAGTYTCTVTGTCGQAATESILEVRPNQRPSFVSETQICSGATLYFTVNPAENGVRYSVVYENEIDESGFRISENGSVSIPIENVVQGGQYHVYALFFNESLRTEMDNSPLSITVLPTPEARIVTGSSVCLGSAGSLSIVNPQADITYTLNATGAEFVNGTVRVPEDRLTTAGTYSFDVTASAENGCNPLTLTGTVQVNALPTTENLTVSSDAYIANRMPTTELCLQPTAANYEYSLSVNGNPDYLLSNTGTGEICFDISASELEAGLENNVTVHVTDLSGTCTAYKDLVINACVVQGKLFTDNEITAQLSHSRSTFLVNKDIEIKNNASLKLTDVDMFFAEDIRLLVEQGGALSLNNGIDLSSACNHYWQGIEVWGNPTKPQTAEEQGLVTNRGEDKILIENALCGIMVGNFDDSGLAEDFGGGILMLNGSEPPYNGQYSYFFRNNVNDVYFKPYESPVSDMNKSYITGFSFTTNEYMVSTGYNPKSHIVFYGVNGISVKDCGFENTNALAYTPEQRGTGIFSYESGFYSAENTFTGLAYGISAEGFANSGIKSRDDIFTNNHYGVLLTEVSGASFKYGKFNIGAVSGTERDLTGILVKASKDFIIDENVFSGAASGNALTYGGIFDYNQTANRIYHNTFNELNYGIRTLRKNPELTLECNTFTNISNSAVYINDDDGLKIIQLGTGRNIAAGNIFSPDCILTNGYYDIYNRGRTVINYYTENTPEQRPDCKKNVSVLQKVYHNTCPDTEPEVLSQQDISDMTALKTEADQKSASIEAQTDGGNTADLLNRIDIADPSETLTLQEEMRNLSPWLSDTVLIKTAHKNQVIPTPVLRNVYVKNPQTAKDNGIQNALDKRTPIVPEYIRTEILDAGLDTLSAKELAEAELSTLRARREHILSKRMRHYLSDTLGTTGDSLELLLAAEHNVHRAYQLAEYYFTAQNADNAMATFNAIPQTYALTPQEQADHALLADFYTMKAELMREDKTWFFASAEQKQTLEDLAAGTPGTAREHARAVLTLLVGRVYLPEITLPEFEPTDEGNKSLSEDKTILHLNVYPNPAEFWFVTDYAFDKAQDLDHARMVLYDARGNAVLNFNDLHTRDEVFTTASTFAPGVYDLRMYDGKTLLASEKVYIGISLAEGQSLQDLKPFDESEFELFPNPAHDHIILYKLPAGDRIRITDTSGKEVLNTPVDSRLMQELTLPRLAQGMYILNIGTVSRRFEIK